MRPSASTKPSSSSSDDSARKRHRPEAPGGDMTSVWSDWPLNKTIVLNVTLVTRWACEARDQYHAKIESQSRCATLEAQLASLRQNRDQSSRIQALEASAITDRAEIARLQASLEAMTTKANEFKSKSTLAEQRARALEQDLSTRAAEHASTLRYSSTERVKLESRCEELNARLSSVEALNERLTTLKTHDHSGNQVLWEQLAHAKANMQRAEDMYRKSQADMARLAQTHEQTLRDLTKAHEQAIWDLNRAHEQHFTAALAAQEDEHQAKMYNTQAEINRLIAAQNRAAATEIQRVSTEQQHQFSDQAAAWNQQKADYEQSLSQGQKLYNSLMKNAFCEYNKAIQSARALYVRSELLLHLLNTALNGPVRRFLELQLQETPNLIDPVFHKIVNDVAVLSHSSWPAIRIPADLDYRPLPEAPNQAMPTGVDPSTPLGRYGQFISKVEAGVMLAFGPIGGKELRALNTANQAAGFPDVLN